MKKTAILFVSILLLASCQTVDLSKVAISRCEIVLLDANGHAADAIVPGGRYRPGVRLYNDSGALVTGWNQGALRLTSPNGSFEVFRIPFVGLSCLASHDTFRIALGGGYQLAAGFSNNSAFAQSQWKIDWEGFDSLSFRGANGTNGDLGTDGRDGRESSADSIDGLDGLNGGPGRDGAGGKHVTLILTHFAVDDATSMMLLVCMENGTAFLSRYHPFTIDASGGDGGGGGKGGGAGKGARYTTRTVDRSGATVNMVLTGNDGRPGRGGRGGNGGPGGSITLISCDPLLLDFVRPIVRGGKVGAGGDNGRPADTQDTYRGKAPNGNRGGEGDCSFEYRSFADIVDLIRLMNIDGMDVQRLRERGT
jgi:hypothetical protein